MRKHVLKTVCNKKIHFSLQRPFTQEPFTINKNNLVTREFLGLTFTVENYTNTLNIKPFSKCKRPPFSVRGTF